MLYYSEIALSHKDFNLLLVTAPDAVFYFDTSPIDSVVGNSYSDEIRYLFILIHFHVTLT
jgi:hypothetical protein